MNTGVIVCLIACAIICSISSVYCAYVLHCMRFGKPWRKPSSESRYV